jgi:hypothetical protein
VPPYLRDPDFRAKLLRFLAILSVLGIAHAALSIGSNIWSRQAGPWSSLLVFDGHAVAGPAFGAEQIAWFRFTLSVLGISLALAAVTC